MQKLFTNELNYSKKNKWEQKQILMMFDTLLMQIKTLRSHHPCHVLRARVVAPLLHLSQQVPSLARALCSLTNWLIGIGLLIGNFF